MRRTRSFLRRHVYIFGVITILVGVLLMWPLSVGVMNYTGFCFKEWRYLSEKEATDAAVHDVMRDGPPLFYRDKDLIYYKGIEEFYRINKNCCELTEWAPKHPGRTFGIRVVGNGLTFVRVRYLIRYRDEDGSIKSVEDTEFPLITNCGQAWLGR